jgi:DNA-binding CsgD family transcriptional regulator
MWLFAFRGVPAVSDLRAAVESLDVISATTVVLNPLDAKAVAQIAADIFGAEPNQALLELAARAEGSPFLLVELLRGLQEDGLVEVEAGQAAPVANRLPARFTDNMRARLDRLSDGARKAASVASVLGPRFSFDEVAKMLDAAPATLLEPIDELLRAELLTEDEGRLTFRHDLIREAVRDTLPASARRALQRQAVDVLIRAGAPPVEVAVQLAESADFGDQVAIRALHDAANVLAASDPATAADLSLRAFELAPANNSLRGRLAAETALSLHAAGRTAEGKAFVDGVLGHVLPVDQEAEVLLSIAGMFALSPDVRVEAGRRALALPGLSPELRSRHLARLVHNLLVEGRAPEARELLGEAHEAARASRDAGASFTLDLTEGALEYISGNFAASLARFENSLRMSSAADEPAREILAREWRTEALAALDRYQESLAGAGEQVTTAQNNHQQWALRLWEGWRGRQLFQLGRLGDSAAALEGIVREIENEVPVGLLDAAAVVALGRVAIHTGDDNRVRTCCKIAHNLLRAGTPGVQRHAVWLLSLAAMAAGDPSGAHAHLGVLRQPGGLSVVPELPLDVTDAIALVRVARAVGDDALARAAVASTQELVALNPSVDSIAGTAAQVRGLATDDPVLLSEAVVHFRRSPRRLALASALEDDGNALAELRELDTGIARLSEALELYTELDASWDTRRVRARLRALGVRRRVGTTTPARIGWEALTTSELEVVRLVALGLRNREVGERLFVSPHTVSTHLRHAFTKLGINSRVELARLVSHHEEPPV